ncbi:MAG: alpha-galactosidase, partial [Roseburia sp.]|nr:alpha-galactosidase [Roseburia sp.]
MIDASNNIFHLSDGTYSYAFYVNDGNLYHTYYGKALKIDKKRMQDSVLSLCGNPVGNDCALFETGEQGRCDFRIPSVIVRGERCTSSDFKFVKYEISNKKPKFGMPSIRGDAETLKIVSEDDIAGARLTLYYSVCDGALVRRAEIENISKGAVKLCNLSVCTELPSGDYDMISLDGRWGQECGMHRSAIHSGIHTFSSSRGFTSHQHNPFIAVADRDCAEESGEVYGFNIIYSGNFEIKVERDEKSQLRINAGIGIPEGGITLESGEIFSSPEVVSVYSDGGLGKMSRQFHKLYRKRLINPRFADKLRPIVVNSWESVYFDFDEDKLKQFICGAKGLGIDTVVLDDGWFGHRDSDNSSLGDWVVDRRKLKNGLNAIIDCCKENGMKFGIWFEPEAISPDSELYRTHPDYVIFTQGREPMQQRNQLLLDFSRQEVVEYIFAAMSAILSKHDISYVKWDANRHISDIPDTKKYVGFVKGMYALYEKLTKAFPDIVIEGCASGGGRFDPAILYYSPFIWASDDTDAYERTKIQYGLSLCYPLQTMSNHVSVCPNHQTGRTIPFFTRGAVASVGCLGYELNIALLDEDDRRAIKEQTAQYRENADLILTGELYRLLNPFTDGAFCEEIVREDASEAYVVYVNALREPNLPLRKIKLKGLIKECLYRVEGS